MGFIAVGVGYVLLCFFVLCLLSPRALPKILLQVKMLYILSFWSDHIRILF